MSKSYFAPGEENAKEDSINNYSYLFSEYQNSSPDLKEALIHMFISSGLSKENANKFKDQIIKDSQKTINDNLQRNNEKYPNISFEDAKIISSYTCEAEDRNYSPYKILNSNLVCENRKAGIQKISKYLYILLFTLRKLPKYYLDEKTKYLYRCIKTKVSQKYDPFKPEFVPYVRDPNNPDRTKTFWAFTSCSPRLDLTLTFLNDKKIITNEIIKSGTIFTLMGKDWGYDITLFNFYNETEILLEPERKYKIDEALPEINDIIRIRCEIIDSPEILIESKKIIIKYENNIWPVIIKKTDTRKEVLNYLIEKYNLDYDEYSSIGIFSKNYKKIFNMGKHSKDGDEYILIIYPFIGESHKIKNEDSNSFQIFVKFNKTITLEVNPSNTVAYLKYLIEKRGVIIYEFIKTNNLDHYDGWYDKITLADCGVARNRWASISVYIGSDCYYI